jgi:hypothetical protein
MDQLFVSNGPLGDCAPAKDFLHPRSSRVPETPALVRVLKKSTDPIREIPSNANKGTLFLDEVDDILLELQAKL